MNNKINKYFFKEFSYLFVLILITISFIVWVIQAVNFLDFVTEDGHSFAVYFKYSILTLTKIFTRLFPFAFLTSMFFTILRFRKSNELLILWLSGLNKIKFVQFTILISILIIILQIILSTTLNPLSLEVSRSILKSSDIGFYPSLIKEKKFNDTIKNLTIFIDKKNNGLMEKIYLRDDTSNLESKTIISNSGKIINLNGSNILQLYDGTIETEKKGNIDFVKFDELNINLSLFSTKTTTHAKIQERSTLALLNCYDFFQNYFFYLIKKCQLRIDSQTIKEITAELNSRFGMSLYMLLIGVIINYLIIAKNNEQNQKSNFLIFFISILVIVGAEILVRYSSSSFINLIAYYVLPLILSLILYLNLKNNFKQEKIQ